ncbi:hypothetical protein MN116_006854 [Schistosoma mekongi]|uniref:Deltamethrin resistance protein prag01 domain-containing protein n=1 Tax=Schistosoma mekongi TaxID=38744 RepID=A0AAE2D306_SCHME|nr:hypothetical protein MN116_006854 [Schistosoma mekongi]
MNSRLVVSCRIFPSIGRINHVRNHVPIRFPSGTYDELQIPQGCWAETHKQRNALYNKYLIVSSVIVTAVAFAAFHVSNFNKYSLPAASNSEDGLRFLNPDPKALQYVLEN